MTPPPRAGDGEGASGPSGRGGRGSPRHAQRDLSAEAARGYGNILTPHAGAMVIQVQREGGLANRTIVLSERQVRALRFFRSRIGVLLLTLLGVSWLYFGLQAARVPMLTAELRSKERDAARLDSLERTLIVLQARYSQVTRMLRTAPPLPNDTLPNATPVPGIR